MNKYWKETNPDRRFSLCPTKYKARKMDRLQGEKFLKNFKL